MKRHIYMETGVVALAFLGAGVLSLLQDRDKSSQAYFLIALGILLLILSFRLLNRYK